MPPNYRNGKIYSIRSYLTDDIYIGSTTLSLSRRMSQHRDNFKRGIYVSSQEIMKHGDAYIELVEDCPCDSREQLHRREGQVIRITDKCVNKFIAGRTDAERYQDNKEAILQRQAEYRQNNKEAISQRLAEYYQDNKTAIIQNIKEYQATHKEQINRRRRELYALKKAQKITSQNIISTTDIECQQNSPNSVLNSVNSVSSPSNQSAV